MSTEREALRLRDIIDNIDRIVAHVGEMDFSVFAADAKTIDAVERCLQRITEAVIKIGPERMAILPPTLPVDAVRGLGNALRHDYNRIDLRRIYTTVTDSLPRLRADCVSALGEARSQQLSLAGAGCARAGRRHALLWRDPGLVVLASAGKCWDLGWAGHAGYGANGMSFV